MSGAATAAAYQSVLRGVQYENDSAPADTDRADRIISVTATDGIEDSIARTTTVSMMTGSLAFSGGPFTEATANDGAVTGAMTVTLSGDTFTGTTGTNLIGNGVTASAVPAGLTPVLTRESDTQATLTLTGTATSHADGDDISNLTLAFGDGAFGGNDASVIAGTPKTDIAVDFDDPASAGDGTGGTGGDGDGGGGEANDATGDGTASGGESAPETPTGATATTETTEGTTVTTTSETNDDGTTTETRTIAPFDGFQEGEGEDDGQNALSDHVLAGDGDAPAVVARLPLGVGLTSSGKTTPQTPENALQDLIKRIENETEEGSETQTEMTGAGQAFLNGLPENTQLYVNTITPTVAGTTPPTQPIIITGSDSEDGTQEALVIDVSGLPSGTVIQLDGVEFAAIVGKATVNGGAGNNVVVGDDGAQIIVLGAGDDILDGGAGDDRVGSEGGDDILIGGLGNDTITGGEGVDTAEFAGAFTAATIARSQTVVTVTDAGGTDLIGEDVELLAFSGDRGVTLVRPDGNAIVAGVGFDAAFYLAQNADVAEAVAAGVFASAADHFARHGLTEGRAANALFDPDAYVAMYQDVAAAVAAGTVASAQQHFALFGAAEGRDPSGWFDASAYLDANPDVADAGLSALTHFIAWGAAEGRMGFVLDDALLVA